MQNARGLLVAPRSQLGRAPQLCAPSTEQPALSSPPCGASPHRTVPWPPKNAPTRQGGASECYKERRTLTNCPYGVGARAAAGVPSGLKRPSATSRPLHTPHTLVDTSSELVCRPYTLPHLHVLVLANDVSQTYSRTTSWSTAIGMRRKSHNCDTW